ncbi:helix-turn-helix domain-containing protein [Abyssalbus ytuae]|uniref:Helix-turn-helix domain-containing protein n=1 Tax=Abyssalbus ytuae TaxID=2926907 RepID=A0A9E7D131_9FLAO|nr:helix-turn-helix domain-containing protein [Abyssalbus ytuae]UOB16628.1 helix-turn-helix domain-containing protein [Abyssalbus ytuae]
MSKLATSLYLIFFLFTSVFSQKRENNVPLKENIERLTKLQSTSYDLGDYKNFKLYTDSILTIAKANQLKEYEIDAIIRLGVYYKKIDAYDQAMTYYSEALEISRDIPNSYKKQTVILINLGNVYNQIGYHDKAKKSFEEAFNYIEDFGGPDVYRMAVYTGLSDAASGNKNFTVSLEYLEKAKGIGEKLKRDDIIINALNGMAENYLQLQQYEQALTHSKKAEALYTNGQSIERRALSHYLIGASLVELKRYNEAVLPLQKAQGTAISNQFLKIQMDTHKQLAQVFEKLENLEKANAEQKGYINAKEKYLQTLSKAKRLEVEQELAKTEKILERQYTFKWSSILIGIAITFTLLGILFVYRKKKKQAEFEAHQLKEDRVLLQDENDVLKAKILKLVHEKSTNSLTERNGNRPKKSSLSKEEQEKYVRQIVDYMEKEQPYLDHEMKQSALAESLDMSVHLFSEVLNVCFEKNFNNFMNLYRVDKAKQLIKDPAYSNHKILAIGYEAGFPSKTSFNRVFKQLVGQTPSEYRQQQLIKGNA